MNTENRSTINSFLSFKLGDEEFAANVGKVLNILEMTRITEVPRAPEYMKGVINLRGTVLPVIDTRIKFGMSPIAYTTNTCIIVIDIHMDGDSVHVGALVDSVQAVLEFDTNQIMPAPSIGSKYRSEFIEGVVNVDDKFILILNMDTVFSTDELSKMQDNSKETENPVLIADLE